MNYEEFLKKAEELQDMATALLLQVENDYVEDDDLPEWVDDVEEIRDSLESFLLHRYV